MNLALSKSQAACSLASVRTSAAAGFLRVSASVSRPPAQPGSDRNTILLLARDYRPVEDADYAPGQAIGV